jgi:hypothetical protein
MRMTDSTAAPAAREAWADALKGVLILFVVIWHVIMKSYLQVDWQLGLLAGGRPLPAHSPALDCAGAMKGDRP